MENHFDTVAREWDLNPVHAERTKAIAAAMINTKLLPPAATGLEFGAGTGLLSIALKDHFSEIILMDNSTEMVRITTEKLARSGIQHLYPLFFDLEKEAYLGKPVDIVFSQMALHHVGDVGEMLYQFHRMLKPGGVLFIADLYTEDGTFHDQEFHGHKGFEPIALSTQLDERGFTQVEYKSCYVIQKSPEDRAIMEYPVFLMSALKKANL
jgi:ubiquinone/menaquinone biosynthesis C-methylase UbiE